MRPIGLVPLIFDPSFADRGCKHKPVQKSEVRLRNSNSKVSNSKILGRKTKNKIHKSQKIIKTMIINNHNHVKMYSKPLVII